MRPTCNTVYHAKAIRVEFVLTILLLALFVAVPAQAIEPWADTNMPVKDGLVLWLDGAHALGPTLLEKRDALETWFDASGKGRNLTQPNKEQQPKLMRLGGIGVLRFDGIDDSLRLTKQGVELDGFTVILVAAPRQNLGAFRALMALNATGERDYTSGLNIDQGPNPSGQFTTLNVEGRGFGGVANLLKHESPFARLHWLVVTSDAKGKSVRALADGKPEGERPRTGEPISMDEVTVGARFYNNGPGAQQAEGHGRSDICEFMVFNRQLSPDELASLDRYFDGKYSFLKDVLPPDHDMSKPLEPVKDPPPLQVFWPGFTVRELPLDLTNINNVKYRADGALVAVGYDGKIWLLRDTDGDGLENKADLFWDNPSNFRAAIGMDLTPPGFARGNGVFVVGKSRLSLIVDKNGDDKADEEIEVAGGWKEGFQPVDGLGVAFDPRDGSVYYGRGTYNYTDPLLHNKEGKPEYKLTDEAGTIMHVLPDLKTREIMVTGIRFPVSLRINERGDLFATDQEGATWVPNGNPFDELLHIQKGRHYGFPSRHPVHLPNVIDEPSTFDYSPQHQCTCGMNFNYPVKKGGPTFGPKAWAGDLFVTGYSRGKLFHTQLSLSPAGYVARSGLLGQVSMLTVDACPTPDGGLVVVSHSGGPDWGSGPTGKGKLLKITYEDPEHPQPVVAWAQGQREVHVEFDRPVQPKMLSELMSKATLTAGRSVRAGDRFETLWPGYAIVQQQKLSPRFDVPIRSAQMTPDGRTLVLATDPLSHAGFYALTLPDENRPKSSLKGALPQHATMDIDFDLSGCEATWQPTSKSSTAWTGWLPHADLAVSRDFIKGSRAHDELWKSLEGEGELTLHGKLDLTDMLRPAVQPGSKIDFEYPPESPTVKFSTTSPGAALSFSGAVANVVSKSDKSGSSVSFTVPADAAKLVLFELRLKKSSGPGVLNVSWTTNEDSRLRPMPLRRMLLPWANVTDKLVEEKIVRPKELEGGSWARGYHEFYGEKAICSKCHTIYGRGGGIGPDLSNLVHRDYSSVVRDITHPSFAINPDFISYNVVLADGRTTTGVVRSSGDDVTIGDAKGLLTKLKKGDIESMTASPVSTMPEKLPNELGPERLRDLLTFLLTPPPAMPHDHPDPRPKARTEAEVNAILAGSPNPPEKTRPLHVLLVAGPKDHGIGEHDYPAWQKTWPGLLSAGDGLTVEPAWEWPSAEQFKTSDVIVFNQHGEWNDKRAADTDAFLAKGGGLVYLHWSLDGGTRGEEFAERIGLAKDKGLAFRHGPLELVFNRENTNPIIRNFDRVKFVDESYWKLSGPLPAKDVLATSVEDGKPQPQLWTTEKGKGRLFVCIPGHYSWTFDDPLYRVLVLRGIAWTAHEPVDRFNELVWLGADR